MSKKSEERYFFTRQSNKGLFQHSIYHMMVVTNTSLKSLALLKTVFFICKNKSMQLPSTDLKHVGVLIKLCKDKVDIKVVSSTLVGVPLKSPKITILS